MIEIDFLPERSGIENPHGFILKAILPYYTSDYYQEALIGLWSASEQAKKRQIKSFSTYAFRCIRNQLKAYKRFLHHQNCKLHIAEFSNDEEKREHQEEVRFVSQPTQDRSLFLSEAIQQCRKALSKSKNDRKVFDLLLQGYSNKEIAEKCNHLNSYETAKKAVSRILKKLKYIYGNGKPLKKEDNYLRPCGVLDCRNAGVYRDEDFKYLCRRHYNQIRKRKERGWENPLFNLERRKL